MNDVIRRSHTRAPFVRFFRVTEGQVVLPLQSQKKGYRLRCCYLRLQQYFNILSFTAHTRNGLGCGFFGALPAGIVPRLVSLRFERYIHIGVSGSKIV